VTDAQVELPFLLTKANAVKAAGRAAAFRAEGLLPTAFLTSNIHFWVTAPQNLKTHDWQFLKGLPGMYMISGLLNDEYQRLYGEVLHVCNLLWSKRLEEGEAAKIQLRSVTAL
jgi:hypothetical protein